MIPRRLMHACLILPLAFPAAAQTFEQIETRPFRNPEVEAAARAGGHAHRHAGHGHEHAHGEGHEHGIETENLFGFTLGSDTEEEGARGVAVESVGRFGKRDAHYGALGQKLEASYGVTDDLSVSAALLGDHHRVRARPSGSAFEDVDARYMFNGFGGELRYRFLDRKRSPFGLTLHLEPSIALSDELTGLRGRKYGSENKLILDRELVPDRLFAAFNLLHEIERVREKGSTEIERASKAGASLSVAARLGDTPVFLGAETRYLRAYQGFSFARSTGDAWYAGPFVAARVGEHLWFNLAYSGLIGGRERDTGLRPNLTDFERHQVRLKVGYEF